MKKSKVTLHNNFHRTQVVVTAHSTDPYEAWLEIQCEANRSDAGRQRLRRIEKALCGLASCRCGIVR